PARTAEEVVDGGAQPLARDVPQRLLDTRDRAPEVHRPALGPEVVIGHVTEVRDVPGIAAHEVAAEGRDVADDGLIAIGLRVALAPAVKALVRLDLDEEPRLAAAGIDQMGCDGGDLHDLS